MSVLLGDEAHSVYRPPRLPAEIWLKIFGCIEVDYTPVHYSGPSGGWLSFTDEIWELINGTEPLGGTGFNYARRPKCPGVKLDKCYFHEDDEGHDFAVIEEPARLLRALRGAATPQGQMIEEMGAQSPRRAAWGWCLPRVQ